MMKRIFRFAAKPDVYVDPTWGDPDRLPENSQSPDSAPISTAQLLDHRYGTASADSDRSSHGDPACCMRRLSPVRRDLSGTSESVNMSILWKNPAAASRDGILRSWGCLGYLIQLASLARESAFVKKLQISTTFERSGRPARRRLTFIGSQSPNQTKKHPSGCFFVWQTGTL